VNCLAPYCAAWGRLSILNFARLSLTMLSRLRCSTGALLASLSLSLSSFLLARPASDWKSIAPGMDLKYVTAKKPSSVGDSRILILRMDPSQWQLETVGITQTGESAGHTARAWSQSRNFSAAINAGMFATDYKTHLGYMGSASYINNNHPNAYQSVAAFEPHDSQSLPLFHIFDLDAPGIRFQDILKDYTSVLQNLRLVKRPSLNQWSQQERKWSEAALGEDGTGRILFMYSRSPFSMHHLNGELLAADIGLVAAQHLEGGPEAQLYVHVGTVEMELCGSYETSIHENDANSAAWPVPNILGVRPRLSAAH
jgi:phosphodiester glycosidase